MTISCLKIIMNPDTKCILHLDKSDMLKVNMKMMTAFMEKILKLFKPCDSIQSFIKKITNLKIDEV